MISSLRAFVSRMKPGVFLFSGFLFFLLSFFLLLLGFFSVEVRQFFPLSENMSVFPDYSDKCFTCKFCLQHLFVDYALGLHFLISQHPFTDIMHALVEECLKIFLHAELNCTLKQKMQTYLPHVQSISYEGYFLKKPRENIKAE